MGLFNLFKNRQTDIANFSSNGNGQRVMPKEIFIEENDPLEQINMTPKNGVPKGIEAI